MSGDTFRTVAQTAEVESKVMGSRFIGRVWSVKDEATIADLMAERRRTEYTATHHCSAYRLGPDAEVYRAHDDGEPGNTAGQPILRQIEARELSNTLVVVTRYYGGTKLGTGGLIRAYGEAASLALDAAGVRTVVRRVDFTVSFDYADTSAALHTIGQFDALTRASRYTHRTEIDVAVRRSQAEAFAAAFVDALGGRGTVRRS